MGMAGKIYHDYTFIEIDEEGKIWVVLNHFESSSAITEMESTARGFVMIDEDYVFPDEEEFDLYE